MDSKPRSGWHSSKLHLALIGMALVSVAFALVVLKTGSAAGFGEFAITIVSLVATYSGARVGETLAQRSRAKSGEGGQAVSDREA